MHNNEREEIKQKILKRIADNETFTRYDLEYELGGKARKIVSEVISHLRKQGKIDYYKNSRQYIWYKTEGDGK